jgi:hypothetical protein
VKRLLLSTIVVSNFFLFSTSCGKQGGPCEEAQNLYSSEVLVNFRNEAGDYLYKEINPLYDKDSLRVFDQNGNQLVLLSQPRQIPNTTFSYYAISFGNIYDARTDQSSFASELCKKFYIEYNYKESDTLQTCFKSKKTSCGSVFESLKVFKNNTLLTAVKNTTVAQITLIKR